MQALTLTTTLSELNRLFGLYYEVADQNTPNSEEAKKAWVEYETYARRYNKERGLKITLEPFAACSWSMQRNNSLVVISNREHHSTWQGSSSLGSVPYPLHEVRIASRTISVG